MRKYIAILLAFIILFTTPVNSLAAKKSAKKFEQETIHITDGISGKEYELKPVNLMMGGQDVISDVPAVLFEGRTLVPIRFIVENLEAEIDWDQEQWAKGDRKVRIVKDDKEIILEIDKADVLVNGEKYTLPDGVPCKLFNSRTMVPLRFVTEQLGMEVGWIGETTTVTIDKPLQYIEGISYDTSKKFPEIRIKTTGEVETSAFLLEGSEVGGEDRLVVDIPNTKLQIEDQLVVDENGLIQIDIYERGIKGIRASQFSVEPLQTRLVVDLDEQKGYETIYDEESKELIIRFINTVRNVKIDKVYDVDTVVIKTSEEPIYNIMFLDGKVVVDVLNSLLKYDAEPLDVNQGGINKVRFAQFKPDQNYDPDDKISRIVVDLEENITNEDVYIEHVENEIFVYVSGNPLEGLDYFKEDVNIAKLTINTDIETEYAKRYDEDDRELTIKVAKDKANLDELDVDIDDNIIESIKVDDKRSNDYYYVNIRLAKGTKPLDYTNNNTTNQIEFSFVNDKLIESKYNNRLVVIDPGHGGHDPGALSPRLRVKEKDVVLETSLKLKKLLEQEGFKVYMTRDDDTYIGLYDRTTIANELGADIFVSVHANAHSKSSIEGVQVLYYPYDKRDNKTFADMMRNALVRELGAPNKGIIERPNLVVPRESKMPAVLLELGFLTNPKEEQLLSTSEYRQKCAEATFKGIIEYFDNVILK